VGEEASSRMGWLHICRCAVPVGRLAAKPAGRPIRLGTKLLKLLHSCSMPVLPQMRSSLGCQAKNFPTQREVVTRAFIRNLGLVSPVSPVSPVII